MSLRNQIIRLAHENPSLRPHLLGLLRSPGLVTAASPRVAVNEETIRFTDWVMMNLKDHPWSEREMQTYLERVLGVDPAPYVKVEKRGPQIEVGDLLTPKPDKSPPQNQEAATQFKYQPGTVEKVEHDSVLLKFQNGQTARFFGTSTGASSGLFRFSEKADYSDAATGKKLFEAVYFAKPGDVEPYRKHVVQEYIERGADRGEDRQSPYYSGYIVAFKYTKEGNVICTMNSQQRPYPVTFSPAAGGQLLYLGEMRKRPTWEADFKRDLAEVGATLG